MKTMILSAAIIAGFGLQAANAEGLGRGMGNAGFLGGEGFAMEFGALDADGDGLVTADELRAAAGARFALADADGDGALSPEEMAAAVMAARAGMMQERMAERLARLDTNGDGLLQLEELEARMPPVARMIDRHDTDGDGAISAEEMEAARTAMQDRGHRGQGHGRGEGRGFGWGQGPRGRG